MSTIAALVDYGITPKRFTPGWEEMLSKRSMGLTYAAMALGLTAGAMLSMDRTCNILSVNQGANRRSDA
jgi:hypothetical protein